MTKLEIGKKVYLKPMGNKARYGNKTIETREIKKIGRKYFEVWDGEHEHSSIKFHIDGLKQVTDYSPDWYLYFSEQEILDESESYKLNEEIRKAFSGYGKSKYTLEQLRKISVIINE